MADFGGFNVTTPMEVMAALQQQQQQIRMIQDPNQQAQAQMQFTLSNLFGGGPMMRAKKAEDRMKVAETGVQKSGLEPGTLDYEKARLGAMFDAVKDVDPQAASQIVSRMTELDNELFERNRLKAQEVRQERYADSQLALNDEALKASQRRNILDNVAYMKTEDSEGNPVLKPYDISTQRNEIEQAKLRGGVLLSREEAVDAMDRRQRNAAILQMHNNSTFSKKLGTADAQIQGLKQATRLVQILGKNPGAATSWGGLQKTLGNTAQEGISFLQTLAQKEGKTLNLSDTGERLFGYLKEFQWWNDLGEEKAAMESLALNMAYTLARSLDDTGRLSDADVMFAARMLGSTNGNPKSMVRAMTENVVGRAIAFGAAEMDDLEAFAPYVNVPGSQPMRLNTKIRSLNTWLDLYKKAATPFFSDPSELESIYHPGDVLEYNLDHLPYEAAQRANEEYNASKEIGVPTVYPRGYIND